MLKAIRLLGYWLLPPYSHPIRYALRDAGIERACYS
jgi:hypothetical protein